MDLDKLEREEDIEAFMLRDSITFSEFIRFFHSERTLTLCNHNREFYHKVLGMTLQDPANLGDLMLAIKEQRWEHVMYISHRLKDMIGMLSLYELKKWAVAIYDQVWPVFSNCGQEKKKLEEIDPDYMSQLADRFSREFMYTLAMYEKIKM
ncbi:MAG: hypothetical protein IJ088_07500 [Clostridia bacterium]|nr:hypothetical protein [Clostridia bacterium]